MLSNTYFVATFRFDTAENEPAKNLQNFAQIMQDLPILRISASVGSNGSSRSLRSGEVAHGAPGGRDAAVGELANFRQNCARFRLYQNEILQVNTRLTAFFKIYQII